MDDNINMSLDSEFAEDPGLPLETELPLEQITPLIFNDTIDTSNMTNVLLIDSIVSDKQQFYDSVNANTFPIIYSYNSSTDELLALFRRKFPASSIQRISLVFHDRGTNFTAAFMNNKLLFEESDLAENQKSFTENVSFLIKCINEFNVRHIDFLACNTLQYSNWKSYYALLASQTSVVVGASNDQTGNLNHGGDWVMESTNENVRDLYFNENISNYASTLALTTITLDGANGDVGLRMNADGVRIDYYNTTTATWTPIGSGNWPVRFVNSNLSSVLRIVATQTLNFFLETASGTVECYFIAGSEYITFDGSSNTINISNIINYSGLIQNGTSGAIGNPNIVVQNFIMRSSNGSALTTTGGWVCRSFFGRGVLGNKIIGCTNNGIVNRGGGIAGSSVGSFGGSVTFTNCTNNGGISGISTGGIAAASAGDRGSANFINCTNSGNISGNGAGGIAGVNAGIGGSASFTNCTNAGVVAATRSAGGIAGANAGNNGSASFTNCTNLASIGGTGSGGIAGANAGDTSGLATFTGCTNSGTILGIGAGGIVGQDAGSNSGLASITNCANIGNLQVQATYAGGIAGIRFGFNTSKTCVITGCYNNGNNVAEIGGGIVGANVGFSSNTLYTGSVEISNSYSLGIIDATCGGICGGKDAANYVTRPNITISNCYVWSGGTGEGLVAVSLTTSSINLATSGTYIAAFVGETKWTDASANAMLTSGTTPTNINTNNPGSVWTSRGTNVPYVLSAYNAALYDPNSASAFNRYTSAPSVFGSTSGYTYTLLYTSQAGSTATTRVFVSKGTAPYYYSYNLNTFAFTNTASSSPLNSSVNSSNGILSFGVDTYTMAYNGNTNTSGTAPVDNSSPYDGGSSVSVLGNTGSLAKTGYPFIGWNTLANGTGTAYSEGNTFSIVANTTLYAQWTYSVTYNGNTNTSGTAPVDGSSPYAQNSSVSVLGNTGLLEKTGFTFAGWNTLADGTGTAYSEGNTFLINANTILYAQWNQIIYTMAYDGNTNTSGTAPVDPLSPYNYGSSVIVKPVGSLAKIHYTFAGWNTDANGSGTSYSAGNIFTIYANTTMYAQWNPIIYTITYNGNTNTSGVVPINGSSPYIEDSSVSVLGNTGSLGKSGYTFAGWNTLANGTGTAYSPTSTFTIYANTILYAQWELINTTRYCPVPKIKGLYYPSQEQLYKQFKNENCNIQKKLPGTLGGRYVGALSGAMRKSQWIGLGAASKGQTRFVLNADELGMREGQPGGILAPIRNRF